MRRRFASTLVVFVMLFSAYLSVQAGGWAAVHPIGEIPPAVQQLPWTMSFLVKQHDVTSVNVDRAVLSATHRRTGETITANATQTGGVGNYRITAVFPLVGDWKWSITPEPFDSTSFATLTVHTDADHARHDASPVASTGSSESTVEIVVMGDSQSTWQITPSQVTITTGTTVVWSNISNVHHTASSPMLDFEDSGYVQSGETFQQTFNTPGTYVYHCDPHPWMTGMIEVT